MSQHIQHVVKRTEAHSRSWGSVFVTYLYYSQAISQLLSSEVLGIHFNRVQSNDKIPGETSLYMYIDQNEPGWNTLRFDSRTYTFQDTKKEKEQCGVIPPEYVFVDDKCFMGNGKIKEVILPPKCRIIGRQAFEGCQFRKSVQFPNTLKEIKKRAFAENHNLRQTVFPSSLEILGAQAYRECNNLKKVVFSQPSRCTAIPEGAFDSCVRLNEIILPKSVRVIDKMAFYRCKELKKIQLPSSLRFIGEQAFYFCGLEELVLPPGLVEIGDSAFFRCKNLRHVRIPQSVRTLGRWVFHGSSRLEYLDIFHDPEYIGPWIVNKSCTIRCRKGSKIDAYCDEYELKREYICEEDRKES